MKGYIIFLYKRVLLRKSNIALIFSVVILSFFVLCMNMRTERLYENLMDQAKELSTCINNSKEALSSMSEDDVQYQFTQSTLKNCTSDLKVNEAMIKYYYKKNWSSFYEQYEYKLIETIQMNDNMIDENHTSTSEKNLIDSEYRQLAYIQYLKEHNLTYTDMEYPIFGLNFMVFISKFILPVIILICCLYTLSQLFTLEYSKGLDTSKMLPIGRNKAFICKLCTGISIVITIFFIITLSSFALASIVNSNHGFSYPILMKDSDGLWVAESLFGYVSQWMTLGILFYICITVFLNALSFWIKEDGALFLTGLCVILGLAYLPSIISSLKEIAHNLPTTYMQYASIVDRSIATQYGNSAITYAYGCLLLFIFICLMLIGCYLLRRKY